MRLICRECSAIYEAPDELFASQPREVRCNRCGYQWVVPAATPAPAPVEASIDAPVAPSAPPPVSEPTAPPAAPHVEDIAPPAAAHPVDAEPTTRDSDTRPITPQPLASPPESDPPAAAAPSTRVLLDGRKPAVHTPGTPDPEERRLALDTIFASHGTTGHRRGMGGWGLWLTAMVIIVVVIAAILFEPQLVHAVPALAKIYAAFGL